VMPIMATTRRVIKVIGVVRVMVEVIFSVVRVELKSDG